MMGSSRPIDPSIAAANEVAALLRALASGGIQDAVSHIEEARDSAVTSIEQAHQRLIEASAAHEQKNHALTDREAALNARADDLDDSRRRHEIEVAVLNEAKQKNLEETGVLATAKHQLAVSQKSLEEQRQHLEQEHGDRSRQLEEAHSRRLSDHHLAVAAASDDLRQREDSVKRREEEAARISIEHANRVAVLEVKEHTAIEAADAAEAIRVQYEKKLATLRSLVG